MSITTVRSQSFLTDTVLLLRNKLKENIKDPLMGKRPFGNKFVFTSYPMNTDGITYPIITLIDRGISQPAKLGMGSEGSLIEITIEIRIWARNIKERDELFDDVYTYLRQNQLDADIGLVDSNLFDFKLLSAVNIDEDGRDGIKSKVMEVGFLILCQ
jgi:hypothetical protein